MFKKGGSLISTLACAGKKDCEVSDVLTGVLSETASSTGFLGPLDDLIGFVVGFMTELSKTRVGSAGLYGPDLTPSTIVAIMQTLLEEKGLKSFLPPSLRDTLATSVLPAILKITETLQTTRRSGTEDAADMVGLAKAMLDALLSGAELDSTATAVR